VYPVLQEVHHGSTRCRGDAARRSFLMVYVDTSVWVDLLTPELAPGTGAARVDDFGQGLHGAAAALSRGFRMRYLPL
ncbi:MAG: hypothetical protein KA223_08215, partial [Candidatus Accumulibacter sp.]|nr:hypothetical protein [Accumulibacter sp.]